jgi:hypothetical protein
LIETRTTPRSTVPAIQPSLKCASGKSPVRF